MNEEVHYIDPTRLHEIPLDFRQIYDMQTKDLVRVNYRLEPSTDSEDMVNIKGISSVSKEEEVWTIDQPEFTRILEEVVFSENNITLEQTTQFRGIMDHIVDEIVKEQQKNGKVLLPVERRFEKNQGIGILVDSRSGQEVGTIERLFFTAGRDARLSLTGEHIILSGKTPEEIASSASEYKIFFYSLEDELIYEFSQMKKVLFTHTNLHESDYTWFAQDVSVIIHPFYKDHSKYKVIQEAQLNKGLIGNDEDDQVDSMMYDTFKEKRLNVIQESREQARKQKIISQFDDIDLDF